MSSDTLALAAMALELNVIFHCEGKQMFACPQSLGRGRADLGTAHTHTLIDLREQRQTPDEHVLSLVEQNVLL